MDSLGGKTEGPMSMSGSLKGEGCEEHRETLSKSWVSPKDVHLCYYEDHDATTSENPMPNLRRKYGPTILGTPATADGEVTIARLVEHRATPLWQQLLPKQHLLRRKRVRTMAVKKDDFAMQV